MDAGDRNLASTLFGEKYCKNLPEQSSELLRAIKVEFRKDIKECKEVGEPQPLEAAAQETLKEKQWWCPAEFDGARWKTIIIPPPWMTRNEWDAHEVTVVSRELSASEPYGKGVLKLMRDTAVSITGDQSVSVDDQRETLDQLDLLFRKMEGCDDEHRWNLLEMAFRAGQKFSKLFSDEEGKRIAKKGFKQVEQQGKGRPKGSENATSKKKGREEAKAAHEKKKQAIISLWRETTDHNAYTFLELLVRKDLAQERGDNSFKYQLAGQGKHLPPDGCTRKIRDWVNKSQ